MITLSNKRSFDSLKKVIKNDTFTKRDDDWNKKKL